MIFALVPFSQQLLTDFKNPESYDYSGNVFTGERPSMFVSGPAAKHRKPSTFVALDRKQKQPEHATTLFPGRGEQQWVL
jgi:hypothetical protein